MNQCLRHVSFLAVTLGSVFPHAVPSLEAQRLHVETFTADEGLPSAQVQSLAQSPDGRLWIVHRGGVSVFDGGRFRTYGASDGLPSRELGELTIDPAGQPWVVTRWSEIEVLRFRDGRFESLPVPAESRGRPRLVTALTVGGTPERPRVAVGSIADGFYLWREEKWERWFEPRGMPSDEVADLVDFGESIALATSAGLCFFAAGRLDCEAGWREPRLAEPLLALHRERRPEGEDRLWILAKDWLGHFEAGRLEMVADRLEIAALQQNPHGTLGLDGTGGVYFGTEAQAFLLTLDAGARPNLKALGQREGLVSEGMTTFLLDRESNVWLGTLRGLSRIENRRFLSFDQRQGLLEDEVTTIVELAPDRLLLGHNVGLTLFEENRVSWTWPFTTPSPGPMSSFRVVDMTLAQAGAAPDGEEDDGGVWIAAHRLGLLYLAVDRTLTNVPVADRVYAVEHDARGRLWISAGEELYVGHAGQFRRVVPNLERGTDGAREPVKRFYRWLNAAPDGRFFVSTQHGLLWHDGGQEPDAGWHLARGPNAVANTLYGVLPRPDGKVWVATGAGLFELAGEELIRPSQPGLAIDRPLYFLLPEGERTWFGTDDGVFVWDGQQSRHLTLQHGLAGRETNRGAALVDRRGRVWIGTVRGLSLYQRHHDRPPSAPPSVELSSIEVNGAPQSMSEELRLSHRENNLTFHFDTVAFARADPVLVRYRLTPLDNDWREPAPAAASEVIYPNLPPGDYRFEIEAGWEGGEWGARTGSERIRITAPFWRRGEVLTMTVLFGAALLIGGHRLRIATIRRRNLELESVVAELERLEAERRELIGELENRNTELERFVYTVSHDLKSPLFTVEGFLGFLESDVAAGQVDRARRDIVQIRSATAKMGRLLSELLELSRIGRVANPSADVELTELAREARDLVLGKEDGRHSIEVEIDPHLPRTRGDRTRLLEVFQNLIENAVKYMGDQSRPRLEIGQRRGDGGGSGEPVIFVRDNGTGIEPKYHEKIFGLFERLDTSSEGTGIGLALVQRIIEVHGGRVWVESAGRGTGSTFCFILPPLPPAR